MKTLFKHAGLAAAVAMAPVAASAVTVDAFIGKNGAQETIPGNDGMTTITFDVQEAFQVNGFNLTANGFSDGRDIGGVAITYNMMVYNFEGIEVERDGLADGSVYIPGFYSFQVDDKIVFEFDGNGNDAFIFVDAVFDATPVPLPAGGLLLLSALGAGVVASRRKKA